MVMSIHNNTELEELHKQLKEIYSEKNLTFLTTSLIDSFRKKQHEIIKSMAWCIPEESGIHKDNVNKLFSHLIMMLHPDRVNYYRKEIDSGYQKRDRKHLVRFTFLFRLLEDLQQGHLNVNIDSEIRESMEDEYWYVDEDFDQIIDLDDTMTSDENNYIPENVIEVACDFMSVLASKEGITDMILEPFHLENLTGALDVSGYGINDLSGIEYCRHITSLDLSANHLYDINEIGTLVSLRELYLSGNTIGSIESLASLTHLIYLDLSYNEIQDISVLKDLSAITFLNLTGNPLSTEQLDPIRKKGRIVVF